MDHSQMNHQNPAGGAKFDWYRAGTWGAVAIMAFYLVTEHTAHLLAALPYLILLACPLMHIFMHGGHGGHGGHHEHEPQRDEKENV